MTSERDLDTVIGLAESYANEYGWDADDDRCIAALRERAELVDALLAAALKVDYDDWPIAEIERTAEELKAFDDARAAYWNEVDREHEAARLAALPPPPRILWRVEYASGAVDTIEAKTAAEAATLDGWARVYSLPEWAEATPALAYQVMTRGAVIVNPAGSIHLSFNPALPDGFVARLWIYSKPKGDEIEAASFKTLACALWWVVTELEPREPALVAPLSSTTTT